MSTLDWLIIAGVIAPTTAWMMLAVCYHVRWGWARVALASVPLTVVTISLAIWPTVPWVIVAWACLFVPILAWWFSLRPQAERDWAPGMAVLPRVEVSGNQVLIHDFRNFSYDTSGNATVRYEQRTFDLARLRSLDYFLSHWSGPIIAHTLVSFGFEDGQFLVVSVEARRQRWQKYSPVWGLFRSYELIYVLGDERDIVRLRTNVRRERVYLYRVYLPPGHMRSLLLDYLARAAELATRPRWYNSILSNCTTNLAYHGKVPWWARFGVAINGLSAHTLYRAGYLPQSLPFKQLQARSAIRELALAAEDSPGFSQAIRANLVQRT